MVQCTFRGLYITLQCIEYESEIQFVIVQMYMYLQPVTMLEKIVSCSPQYNQGHVERAI